MRSKERAVLRRSVVGAAASQCEWPREARQHGRPRAIGPLPRVGTGAPPSATGLRLCRPCPDWRP
eukprot:1670175-Alexandrium_andersonii.AAC.1